MLLLTVHPDMPNPSLVIPITLLLDRNRSDVNGTITLLHDSRSYDLYFSFANPALPNSPFTVTDDRGHPLLRRDDMTAPQLDQNQELLEDLMTRIVRPWAVTLATGKPQEWISAGKRESFTVGHFERRQILTQIDLSVARGSESKVQEFFAWLEASATGN